MPAIPDLVTALGDSEQLVHNNALAALRQLGGNVDQLTAGRTS